MSRMDEYIQGPWFTHPLMRDEVTFTDPKGPKSSVVVLCGALPGVSSTHALGTVQTALAQAIAAVPNFYQVCSLLAAVDIEDVDAIQGIKFLAEAALKKAHGEVK